MIYIASPYSHTSGPVRSARYQKVQAYNAHLIRLGIIAYSPIVHCHHMAVAYNLPIDADHWRRFNIGMLRLAEELRVFTISGWKVSQGVKFEIDFAETLYIPIKYAKEAEWPGSSILASLPNEQS